MDVEPLLAHREDKNFNSKSVVQRRHCRGSAELSQEVELTDMGQSNTRHNRIEDAAGSDWSFSDSIIKLTIQEILELKDVFKRLALLSPEDQCISKQTFLHYFPLDGMLGQRLFGIFDKDKDDKINSGEFLSGISLCLRGTMSDKCNLLFHMFDLDEDDGVSEDELYRMLEPTLKAADSLKRSSEKDSESGDLSDTARILVNEAFEECDVNQTGRLSLENFQAWLGGHKELVRAVFSYPFQKVLKKTWRPLNDRDIDFRKYQEFDARDKRNNRLLPQTWVDDPDETKSNLGKDDTIQLENSRYLWSPLFPNSNGKFPPSRSKHTAVLYHGYIYLLGGRGKASTLKDFWRYSLADNSWEQVKIGGGTRPPALEGHSAVVFRNQMFVFGGAFTNDKSTPFWSFDFETMKWKDLSQSKFQQEPSNRKGHSAFVYRDSMFLFGGSLDNGSLTSELWRYDFSTLRWHLMPPREGTELITGRHSHSAVVHNNAIWVFGGLDSKGRKNDLWTWDFELFTWTRVRQRAGPSPLARHSGSKVGSLMIICGGEGNEILHNETWTFSFDSLLWKKITPLSSITPTHRCNHTAIVLNPYSAHIGRLRPSTTKSAPDEHFTGLRSFHPVRQQFTRTGSVDSILDYHEQRICKGKSLDLSYELDNPGYDKSFPDIPNEDDIETLLTTGHSTMDSSRVVQVKPYGDSDSQSWEEGKPYHQSNWSVIVIGGKGKYSADLYKSSIDIWKCDIGPDVGSYYHKEVNPTIFKTTGKRQTSVISVGNRFGTKEQNFRNQSSDCDRLIITDLTTDENSVATTEI